jgi:hypothetical protein
MEEGRWKIRYLIDFSSLNSPVFAAKAQYKLKRGPLIKKQIYILSFQKIFLSLSPNKDH